MFPLPLRPFEEYFYRDHSCEYPAVFFFRLSTVGELDREFAQQALDRVIAIQPLLPTVVVERRGRLYWEKTDRSNPIHWSEESDPAPEFQPLDLSEHVPLRMYCVANENGHEIIFQVHHAAVDGLGFVQIVNDWLAIYHSLLSGASVPEKLKSYQPELLHERCRPALSWKQWLSLLPGQWISVVPIIKFLRRRAIPLVPVIEADKLEVSSNPAVITSKLTAEETRCVSRVAGQQQATVNELVIRDLYLAIQAWQQEYDIHADGTHLRLMVPVNERTERHKFLPACNHCTMINLDRDVSQLVEPAELLARIHHAFQVIKRWRLSLNFWRMHALTARLPGGLENATRNSKCAATSVLSNLGNLRQRIRMPWSSERLGSGQFSLDDLEVIAPIRQGTYATFVLYFFQNRLCISMRYDDRVISRDRGHWLAGRLMEQLRSSLSTA